MPEYFHIKNETLAQVFTCEFCEIFKNTFSCRTPPVAASVDNKLLNLTGSFKKSVLCAEDEGGGLSLKCKLKRTGKEVGVGWGGG